MPLSTFPKCYLGALCVPRTMPVEIWIEQAASININGRESFWDFTSTSALGSAWGQVS